MRHLGDELGSGDIAMLAHGELALIRRLLQHGSYPATTGTRLYSLAAEASRQAAWAYFDQDNHPAASRLFEVALRASATAGDPVSGAYAMSFLAVQCYSTGQAQQAVSLLETARGAVSPPGGARMTAMLAARSARAHSKIGHRKTCARLFHEARSALDRGAHPDDPDVLYWVTHGEIEMIAGSSALDLGDYEEAIRCFDAAILADYRGDDQFPRSHAIYLARAAEAHLARHDIDRRAGLRHAQQGEQGLVVGRLDGRPRTLRWPVSPALRGSCRCWTARRPSRLGSARPGLLRRRARPAAVSLPASRTGASRW